MNAQRIRELEAQHTSGYRQQPVSSGEFGMWLAAAQMKTAGAAVAFALGFAEL
jgi:hypothetical protein